MDQNCWRDPWECRPILSAHFRDRTLVWIGFCQGKFSYRCSSTPQTLSGPENRITGKLGLGNIVKTEARHDWGRVPSTRLQSASLLEKISCKNWGESVIKVLSWFDAIWIAWAQNLIIWIVLKITSVLGGGSGVSKPHNNNLKVPTRGLYTAIVVFAPVTLFGFYHSDTSQARYDQNGPVEVTYGEVYKSGEVKFELFDLAKLPPLPSAYIALNQEA